MDKELHFGHRKRMTARVIKSTEGLAEHELLEILLYRSVPRMDTNPLAHRLLRTFGTLYDVLTASAGELLSVEGVGEKIASDLIVLGKIFLSVSSQKERRAVANSFYAVREQIIKDFSRLSGEKVVVILLDHKYNILHELPWVSSKTDNVTACAAEVVKSFAIHKPKFVIVAHNHPSGNVEPSEEDDFTTKKLNVLCDIHSVSLIDHIIIAGDEAFSYCASGRLSKIKEVADIEKLMQGIKE